ncbi:MAG: hypothetical protein CEE43_13465 [Promethearchaeota archaeon Loki_b32]|nr:MAG: hypothetical protein CEE43_13465 [Candidatus Lokiarchaeota archaeon Loki_b32]
MIKRRNFDAPPNPFQIGRNELLNTDVKDYIYSLSVEPFKIPELTAIFKSIDNILLGAPGTGKSSLIRLLVWDVVLEVNSKNLKKFDFLYEYLKSSNKNEILPFFGFYINLHEDLNKNFYGSRLKGDEWKKLFIFYFSIFVIMQFISNIENFFKKTECLFNLNTKFEWQSENIPDFIKTTTTLNELKKVIREKLDLISNFLSTYKSIEEKKNQLRFYSEEFFSDVINDITNSNPLGLRRIILLLDDLSWLPDNLIEPILEIFGRRTKKLEIKLLSRDKPSISKKLNNFDTRDLIIIDLDYILINSKKNYYSKMAKDIIIYRLRKYNYYFNKIEEVFPKLDPLKEAKIYSENSSLIKSDSFFKRCSKNVLKKLDSIETFQNIMNYDEPLNESNVNNILKGSDLINDKKFITDLIYLSDIYRFLMSIENPIDRRICEGLTAREYKNQLPIHNLVKIKGNLKNNRERIENFGNMKNMCLFLIAKEEKKKKIYSGVNTIIKISSYVIKDLFEILDSIFRKYFAWQIKQYGSIFEFPEINYKLQNEAIHEYAKLKYKDKLIKSTKYGKLLFNFINTIEKLLRDQFNIRLSYDNGRTGFALSKLEDFLSLKQNNFINEALANSYIISKDISKGYSREFQKKSEYAFYFNRLICVYYNLPIKYGGYRILDYNQIINYIIKGKIPPEKRVKETLFDFIKNHNI